MHMGRAENRSMYLFEGPQKWLRIGKINDHFSHGMEVHDNCPLSRCDRQIVRLTNLLINSNSVQACVHDVDPAVF